MRKRLTLTLFSGHKSLYFDILTKKWRYRGILLIIRETWGNDSEGIYKARLETGMADLPKRWTSVVEYNMTSNI